VDLRPDPLFVKAYGHNGYFKSLESLVHFYNTRDTLPRCVDPFTAELTALSLGCWPEPEIGVNVNTKELGKLNLTADQEAAIVAFLKTLSDGYVPEPFQGTNAAQREGAAQPGRILLPLISNDPR
jgi:cytochrome c peroxidase